MIGRPDNQIETLDSEEADGQGADFQVGRAKELPKSDQDATAFSEQARGRQNSLEDRQRFRNEDC
jgi:hypothetical protein